MSSHVWLHSWKSLHQGGAVVDKVVVMLVRYLNAHGMPSIAPDEVSRIANEVPEHRLDVDPWPCGGAACLGS